MSLDKPRFCPDGCGETLESTPLTGKELELSKSCAPNYKNHWKIKCTKCGLESYIAEGAE